MFQINVLCMENLGVIIMHGRKMFMNNYGSYQQNEFRQSRQIRQGKWFRGVSHLAVNDLFSVHDRVAGLAVNASANSYKVISPIVKFCLIYWNPLQTTSRCPSGAYL